MRPSVRLGLAALCSASIVTAASAQDRARPTPPTAGDQAAAGAPAPDARAKEVLATVNGDPITRGDLVKVLANYPIQPGQEEEYYSFGINALVNGKLVSQFLREKKIAVAPEELEAELDRQDKQLRANGTTLDARLKETGTPRDELKDEIARTLQWKKYILARATEAELRKYLDAHKEAFDGTLVHARHILAAVEPDAPEADKEKARQKLLDIKKQVQSGQVSFADAANKSSDDHPEGESPEGGDLGYFPRKGGPYIEPFVAAAFKMKKGDISDPIETEYGYHLIQVVDRKPGRPVDFAQIQDAVRAQYMLDVQDDIVQQMRKTAKIDVKPMPKDLFSAQRPPAAGAPAAGGAQGKAETKKD